MKKVNRVLFACAVATLNLAACSSGGSGGTPAPVPVPAPPPPPPPPPPPASSALEGLYLGTTANGDSLDVFIIPGDRLWATYARMPATQIVSYGGAQANGTLTGGSSYAATDGRDYPLGGVTRNGTLSASFSATAGTFNGTATYGMDVVTFTTTRAPASLYVYDTPTTVATLTALGGAWNGQTQYGPITMTISSPICTCDFVGTATISAGGGGGTVGCKFSGSFLLSTKNGYNINKFEQDPTNAQVCKDVLPLSATGLAYSYAPGGTLRLVMATQTADRTKGLNFVMVR